MARRDLGQIECTQTTSRFTSGLSMTAAPAMPRSAATRDTRWDACGARSTASHWAAVQSGNGDESTIGASREGKGASEAEQPRFARSCVAAC